MKKRICFLIDSIFSIGGVQRVTAVIAKELARDYDVTIVTFDKPELKDKLIYDLEDTNITYHFFKYPSVNHIKRLFCKAYSGLYRKLHLRWLWTSNFYERSSFPSELREALKAELFSGNYDVIIGVHAPLASRLASLKKVFPGVKLFGWIHNSFDALFGTNSLYLGPEVKRHYVYQFGKLDRVILLCQHDVLSYIQYDPIIKPSFIYNPLTIEAGKPSKGNSKRFLAIGRFSHQHKGFDLLIEAFHLFSQYDKEWKLDIVGEGPEEELLKSLIQKHQLSDRIFIHPFTNTIQDYYSKAQVYVLSSRWEGFGLVLVEAMAHGLPIISSDLPTSREILGKFGLYFNNGDIKDLSQKLEEATNIDWQEKSKQALEIAHRFEVGPIIEQWKELIEK